MNEIEQTIIGLADTHKDPEEFIFVLERRFNIVPLKEVGDSFRYVGAVLYKYSYFALALHIFNRALEYDIEVGNRTGEGGSYTHLGAVCHRLGDYRKAIEYYEKSLRIADEEGDSTQISRCYVNLGVACYTLGDYRKAIEYYEKSLKINQDIGGDKEVESACYGNLGNAYECLGDFRKAIEYHEKELSIAKEIEDWAGASISYRGLANAYFKIGDFTKVVDYNKESLKIAKKLGDRLGVSQCYASLGNAYSTIGRLRGSFRFFVDEFDDDLIVQELCQKIRKDNYLIEFGTLDNTIDSLNEILKVPKFYDICFIIKKSLKLPKCGERLVSATTNCRNMGFSELSESQRYEIVKLNRIILEAVYPNACPKNNFSKAIGYHEKSLGITNKIGDKLGQLKCYGNMGAIYRSLEQFSEAIEYSEKSLEIAREIGYRDGEVASYTNLGTVCHGLGDYRKAIEYCQKALEIARQIGDKDSEGHLYKNLGLLYYDSAPHTAYDYFRRAIEVTEEAGKELVKEEHKIAHYAYTSDTYHSMVPLCLKLGSKQEEAFQYVERSKAKAFLDMLAATKIEPSKELMAEGWLIEEERSYIARLREIQAHHLRKTETAVELGEVEGIRKKLKEIYDQMERIDPQYVSIRQGKPLSLCKIKDMLGAEKRKVVLVEYFMTEDIIFIFIISSRGLSWEIVRISKEKLQRHIENLSREVVDYAHFGDIGNTWLDLSKYLVDPLSGHLSEGDLVHFIPFGFLHYIPMHALDLNGEPLIKSHPVFYSPSASLMRFWGKKGSKRPTTCACFGVTFEDEAREVATLFGGEFYVGESATKDKVTGCTSKDIIHFSCHGHFDSLDPLSSGVILHDNQVLTAREIFRMRFNTELVTLSACQTGLNQRASGDELIGLTRAFLYAGARSVVVSLWKVNVQSKRELMLRFYDLLKDGKDKVTALQEAQKEIMRQEEYSHSYHWAPFILVGDWR